ncbi:MAG TPA: amidase [Polyangiaceae bacterium]|jgi:amidase
MSSSLPWRPALELAAMLRQHRVSSEDLVHACLERIEEANPWLTAFVQVLGDRALGEARAADARLRKRDADLPPFLGVPLGVKDLNLARGSFARFGSRAFERLFTPFDDAVVAQLRRGGFVIVGKTTTSELGSLPVTEPDIHPPTRNPWDPGVTAGGSSGGAGAAVASGMIPIAQGSDAAGSIRIPAAFCGLFGLKPSRGRIENPFGLDDRVLIWTCGPITRTVDDAAAMLDVMAGVTVGRPHWAPLPARPFGELAREVPRGLTVGLALRSNHVDTDPEIAAAVEGVARTLEKLGHRIVEKRLELPDGVMEEFLPVWQATAASAPVHDWALTQPVTRWLGEKGRTVDAKLVERTTERLMGLVLEQFGDLDAWITPTVAVPPPRVGAWRDMAPPEVFAEASKLGVFTAPFNISGQPAASVPAGRSKRGNPIGAQIAGRPLADGQVLALARQVEAAMPWIEDRPDDP